MASGPSAVVHPSLSFCQKKLECGNVPRKAFFWLNIVARCPEIARARAGKILMPGSDCAQHLRGEVKPVATRRYDESGKVKEPMNGLAILQPFSGRFPLWSKK